MTVRKTENRIPANCQPSDLGQASVAADGRAALISFVTNPLVVGRENVYVVFVTDAALAASAASCEWSFAGDSGAPQIQTTEYGEVSYTPTSAGSVALTVRILDENGAEQARLSLDQEVVEVNVELETLIAEAQNQPGPGVANPDVARELINDHNPYYQNVAPQAPEPGDAFQQFVFSIVFDGALQRTAADRKQHLSDLADSLNNGGADFATLAGKSSGVAGVHLPLLAMTLPSMLDFTELPESNDQRAVANEQLLQTLAALDEEKRIDLFNLVRFPKSNIAQCARILEALRDRYFPGTNFNDVLTGMSGVRAQFITRQFTDGPISRA
jgi:hypothetical protein